jgi:hypothetical protein
MGIDKEDSDTYACSYENCYVEIDTEKMQEGKDFGVMVSRDSVEWRLSDRQPYGLFFTEKERESDECPVKMDGYLLCRDHFVVLRAEIMANRGISVDQFKLILGGYK